MARVADRFSALLSRTLRVGEGRSRQADNIYIHINGQIKDESYKGENTTGDTSYKLQKKKKNIENFAAH